MKSLLCVAFVAAAAAPARAQDRFEIQVYDAESAPRGEVGLETHVNQVVADTAETHVTFEPHLGLTDWLELGGYFQTAIRSGVGLDYAGIKLRLKARLRDKLWDGRIGLALNGELSAVPERYEANVWGSELRPIVDLTVGRFYASVNPIVTIELAGDQAGQPTFEPAAKVALRVAGRLSLGLESYSAFGDETVERVLVVADWSSRHLDVDLGAGYAWGTGDRWLVKAIVGVH